MFFIVGTNRNPNASLSTGFGWKGLISAKSAEKELAESEVADGGWGGKWDSPSNHHPPSPTPFSLSSLPFLSSPHRRLLRLENLITV